jgi:hypothetical protein
MEDNDNLFAPPTEQELSDNELFAPPTEQETNNESLLAPPTDEELGNDTLDKVTRGGVGAVGGGVAGLLGQGVFKLADKYGLPLLGELNREQLDFISSNADDYKAAPNLETKLKEYKTLAEKANQASYDFPRQAKDYLKTIEPWSPEKYYETIGETLKDKRFTSELKPTPVELPEKLLQKYQSEASRIANAEAAVADTMSKVEKGTDTYQQLLDEMATLKAQQNSLNKTAMSELDRIRNAAEASSKSARGIPDELISARPDLAERVLDPALAPELEKAAAKARNVTELSPERLGEGILPALRDKGQYSRQGGAATFSDVFNTDIAEKVRGQLGRDSEDYNVLMNKGSDAIKVKDTLQDAGIKIKDGQLSLPKGGRAKITKMLQNPSDFPDELQSLIKAIDKSKELGLTDKGALEFISEFEAAGIKDIVSKSANLSDYNKRRLAGGLTKAAAGGLLGGLPGLAAGAALDVGGTKLQELIALAQASKLGKGIGAVTRKLPAIGVVAGAGLGAASASEAGLSPAQVATTGAVGAAESFLPPAPVDLTGGAIAGFQEYNKSQDVGQALSAAGTATIKPLDEFGTKQSLSARERMEQNLNAFKGAKTQSAPLVGNYTADDVRATQEWFNASTDPMAQSFKVPLEKAVNAPDERSRAAAMFALEQQPAFRELQRKRK